MQEVNFAEGWSSLWTQATESAPGLSGILLTIGGVLAVWAIVKWMFDARKEGQAKAAKPMWWLLVVAAVLVAPGVILSIALTVVDVVFNLLIGLLGGLAGTESSAPEGA